MKSMNIVNTPAAMNAAETAMNSLRAAAINAMAAYDVAESKKAEITAAAYNDAVKAMRDAVAAYNDAALANMYDTFIESGAPIEKLARALHWSKMAIVTKKDTGTMMQGRSTRFDLLNLLKYAAEHDRPIEGAADIAAAMTAAAAAIADHISANITKEGGASVATVKAALQAVLDKLGIEKLFARSKDIRFIEYAVTRARELGELAKITPAAVAPYIMDVVNAQIYGKVYTFAADKKADAE